MRQAILTGLRAIGLDCPPANKGHHHFARMLALPAPNLWQEGVAGAAAVVGEQQQDWFAECT